MSENPCRGGASAESDADPLKSARGVADGLFSLIVNSSGLGARVSPGVPTKVIAACIALSAFALALVAGLAAENPLSVIILRAVVAMFICQAIGLVLGAIGERVVAEGAARYRLSNPVGAALAAASLTESSSPSAELSSESADPRGDLPVQRV